MHANLPRVIHSWYTVHGNFDRNQLLLRFELIYQAQCHDNCHPATLVLNSNLFFQNTIDHDWYSVSRPLPNASDLAVMALICVHTSTAILSCWKFLFVAAPVALDVSSCTSRPHNRLDQTVCWSSAVEAPPRGRICAWSDRLEKSRLEVVWW